MSTYRANLLARRDAIAAELAAIQNKSLQTDSHEYSKALFDQLERIDKLLSHPNSRLDADELSDDTPKPFTIYECGET